MSPLCDSGLAVKIALPSLRGSAARLGLGSAAGSNGLLGQGFFGGRCHDSPASEPRARERPGRCARGGCSKLCLAALPRCAAAVRTAWRLSPSDWGAVPFAGPPSPPGGEGSHESGAGRSGAVDEKPRRRRVPESDPTCEASGRGRLPGHEAEKLLLCTRRLRI